MLLLAAYYGTTSVDALVVAYKFYLHKYVTNIERGRVVQE
jgi:hypothetical protein